MRKGVFGVDSSTPHHVTTMNNTMCTTWTLLELSLRDGATKVRAKELRDKAFEAVSGCGSSSTDFDALVKDLGQLSSVPTVRE